MQTIRVVAAIVGALVVAITSLSVLRTLVMPGGRAGRWSQPGQNTGT